MKWYKFIDKFPELGSNVLISTSDGYIAIIEFNLEMMRFIKNEYNGKGNGMEDCLIDFYSDDSEDFYMSDACITCAKYWCYPSSINFPKND